jgi:hypothetical protein
MTQEAQTTEPTKKGPHVTEQHLYDTVRAVQFWQPENSTLTVCAAQLQNGSYVVGQSACVSEVNFDANIGKDIAYKNAVDKIWELEGYLLRERIFQEMKNEAEIKAMMDAANHPVITDAIKDIIEEDFEEVAGLAAEAEFDNYTSQ